jgi:hypothetical protein
MKMPMRATVSNILHLSCVSMLLLPVTETRAACTLTPSAGNDSYVCDSNTSPGLTDLSGNNTLTFPAGGTGAIVGNVLLGTGTNRLSMDSGNIQGNVDLGDGANVIRIGAGTITGAVLQGSGADNFLMTGGSIQSLAQGDTRDVFSMTGGTIIGAFEDGDVATMSGGTIGRVDMKLDDNVYDMSGGRIIGNLVTGFGRDTIRVSGGSIGGNVSVSGGNDNITVTGGLISGQLRASFGNDTFTWDGGGQIQSAILMGDGDDIGRIAHLTENNLGATPALDGGLGNDTLTFINTTSSAPARYLGWETVNLTEQSRFDLSGDFFLGDSATGTGTFNIDGSSLLTATQGTIRPYAAGQLATLNNAGVIDMTRGSAVAGDTLSVFGNYVGSNGQLLLQTVLGDDSSASDRLVVSQGSISGNTQLGVTHLGGLGALTRDSGIEVVQALDGAVSSNDAFALRGSLSAGAYQYYLFKGGVTAGTENNWYLRSSVVAVAPLATPVPTPVPEIPQRPFPCPLRHPSSPPTSHRSNLPRRPRLRRRPRPQTRHLPQHPGSRPPRLRHRRYPRPPPLQSLRQQRARTPFLSIASRCRSIPSSSRQRR